MVADIGRLVYTEIVFVHRPNRFAGLCLPIRSMYNKTPNILKKSKETRVFSNFLLNCLRIDIPASYDGIYLPKEFFLVFLFYGCSTIQQGSLLRKVGGGGLFLSPQNFILFSLLF